MDNGWDSVLKSLRKHGYEDWEIARAFAILESGGSVSEARVALEAVGIQVKLPATFESELLLADLERMENQVKVVVNNGNESQNANAR